MPLSEEERRAKRQEAWARYYEDNRERLLAKSRERHRRVREENSDDFRAKDREGKRRYRERHIEVLRAKGRHYMRENRDAIKARSDPAKTRECRQRYYQNNREACLLRTKIWAAQNPERVRENGRKSGQRFYAGHQDELRTKAKERSRLYREQHQSNEDREVRHLNNRRWRELNRDRVRQNGRQWELRNPEKWEIIKLNGSARTTFKRWVGGAIAMPDGYLDAYVAMIRVKRAIRKARSGT